MNHFFAISVPPETAAGLIAFVEQWKPRLPSELLVRWSNLEDYHLTLNFLGNLSRTIQPRLIEAVSNVSAQFDPFTIHLTFNGAFESAQRPSVLWAGLNEKLETTRLSKSIDTALAEQGFVIEPHSYVPHVTLGRCRTKQDNAAPSPVKARLPINLELPVTAFVLMETLPPEERANGTKARYNTVHTFPFGNRQSDVSQDKDIRRTTDTRPWRQGETIG